MVRRVRAVRARSRVRCGVAAPAGAARCGVLSGTKEWVTSGTHADVILAMARTDTPRDRRGPRGIGTFIITPDLPGFHVGKNEAKLGLRASPTVQLHFDNMLVQAEDLHGGPRTRYTYTTHS